MQGVTCPSQGGDGAPHEQPGDRALRCCAHPVANTRRDPATGHQNEPEGPPETLRSAFGEAIPQTLLRKLSQELWMVKRWRAARRRAGGRRSLLCDPKALPRGHRLSLAAISTFYGCPPQHPVLQGTPRGYWAVALAACTAGQWCWGSAFSHKPGLPPLLPPKPWDHLSGQPYITRLLW